MELLDNPVPSTDNRAEHNKLKMDLTMQSVLLVLAVIGFALQPLVGMAVFYFGIGAYQLISSLVHLRFKNHSLGRKFYWPQLIIHALTFASLAVVREPLDILLTVLFTTAFSALYYFVLTLVEYGKKRA